MLVGQKTGSNKIEFICDSNGDYYGFEYNDVPYNFIKNLQGDVVAIADGAGNILVQYYYDAWGRILEIDDDSTNSIGTINPIRYRSYYYDTETGFYYLKTRYYSPEICRFLSSDTEEVLSASTYLISDKNLFAYCDNNPVIRKDTGGQYWHLVIGGIVGGAIAGISSALSGGDGIDIAISVIAGIGSGVLSASGVGIIGQVIGSASIAMTSNATQQLNSLIKKEQEQFSLNSMLFDGIVSAGCAIWSGAGASYGNSAGIKSSGKNFTKQLMKGKNFNKAFTYYKKTAHNSSKSFVLSSLAKSQAKSSFATSIITFKERLLVERYG